MLRGIAYWACLLLPQFAYVATTLPPISIKGSKLYTPNGDQFFVKGVTYYLDSDPEMRDRLRDTKQCEIDAELMADMGVNTIRVYEVDSSYSHDGCMEAFDKRGIYIWIDIDSGSTQINTETPVWDTVMYYDWTSKIDAFARYDNVLAFAVGADRISYSQYGRAAPFVKAAVSDIKAFLDGRGYRRIPIAYSDQDTGYDGEFNHYMKNTTTDYLTCSGNTESIDLFGINLLSACGDYTSYVFDQFAESEIPIIISEVVCTEEGENRNFSEVQTFLSTNYSDVFSGAMVYDWTNDTVDWGLVEYNDADFVGEPELLPAYTRLQSILSSVQPESTAKTSYKPASSAPACPTRDDYSSWLVDENLPPPTISGLPSVTRVDPNGDPIKPTGGVRGSGKGKPGSETEIATEDNVNAVRGGSAAFGGLGLGGLIGVIVGSTAGVLALVGLGWQWGPRPGGAGNSGSDSDNNLKPTNVYLGPQEMSGDGQVGERHELFSGDYSAMQPVTQYAGYLKPEAGGTMSGPTTPSELSPGAHSYRTHSMSDYGAPTGWSSPPPPVQAFEMEGDSGHTPATAAASRPEAPQRQPEPSPPPQASQQQQTS
ncbi:hypothetical protein PG985_010883 [Apiospora marii]|uniref:uncharacterized protein n=1 Tax=Apiospora marii TaxID=335849 RepID=UPI00312DD84F